MDLLTSQKFTFVSHSLPAETFAVVHFSGAEGLSRCYEFDVTLVSRQADLDLTLIMDSPATLTILRDEGDIPFHGILSEFEQHGAFSEYVYYRAVLTPKLQWLALTCHNQIFLQHNVPQILEAVLVENGLTPGLDFELRLTREYPVKEYVCQYGESHLQFIDRWMEREGIYYYFEQTEAGEKVVLTDSKIAHINMPEGRTLSYSPVSGLDAGHREEVIKTLICRRRTAPRKVVVKDYNYNKPSLDLTGQAPVAPDHGRGEFYVYGDHFLTTEEAELAAGIRAESLRCREEIFYGDSVVPYLRPGYVFDLEGHFRDSYNRAYLTTDLTHEGNQAFYLVAGIRQDLSADEQEPYYRNTFTAISAEMQFRSEHKTPKARFNGTISAKIDAAAGAGEYAYLDEQGRYKVVMPFDQSGRKDGKASTWIRMAQPYAGSGHGFHFPLHGGTEVLLSFVDGDPDRPIITGAVPNPETPSMVNRGNSARAGFTTKGNSQLYADDTAGHEHLAMKSGQGDATFRVGSGSGSELSGHAHRIMLSAPAVASFFGILGRHNLSLLSDVSITGTKWAILVGLLQHFVTKSVSDLAAGGMTKKDFEAADKETDEAEKEKLEEEAEEKREAIKELFEASTEIFTELLMFILTFVIEHHVLHHGVDTGAGHLDAAFAAISKGKSTYTINKGTGKDILLATDKGKVLLLAEDNARMVSNNAAQVLARNIVISAVDGEVLTKGKDIKIEKYSRPPVNDLAGFEIVGPPPILPPQKKAEITITEPNGDITIQQERGNADGRVTIQSEKGIVLQVQRGRGIVIGDDGVSVEAPEGGSKRVTIMVGDNNDITLTGDGIAINTTKFEIKQGNNIMRFTEGDGGVFNFTKLQANADDTLNFDAQRINLG